MKKFLIAAAAALMTFGAWAVEQTAHALVITKKSGETVEYKFADEPIASFSGADMLITLGLSGDTFAYPMAEVATLTITPRTLGVEDAVTSAAVSFEFTGDALICRGLAPRTPVALYSVNGRMIQSDAASAEGSATLAVGQLSAGVYIISAGNESFKFIK